MNRFFTSLLSAIVIGLGLALPSQSVAVVGKAAHGAFSLEKQVVQLTYTFEWEVVDAEKYIESHLDKAEVQDRIIELLAERIREYVSALPHAEAMRLDAGEFPFESVRAMALEVNEVIAPLGVQLVDLDFAP